MKLTIAILGAGQIGQAVYQILQALIGESGRNTIENDLNNILGQQYTDADSPFRHVQSVKLFDAAPGKNINCLDLSRFDDVAAALRTAQATHVINAGPFFLNETIAKAAADCGCNYIDFTEDDEMSDKVQAIYAEHPELSCATKCGLAPGFINYVGHDLIKKIAKPQSLMVSVGALPRNVNFGTSNPAGSYALSWSVDGLVNEYIRPCAVRLRGQELKVQPLVGRGTLVLDGAQYETAYTSGGIGSLVKELKHVPDVYYSTIRYPGHYDYVIDAVKRNHGEFAAIKKEFLQTFPFTRDDVIITYAEARGHDDNGLFVRETYANRFYPAAIDLTAIQSTTATGGLVVLELMLEGKLKGIITHSMVPIGAFRNTRAYAHGYHSHY